MFRAVLLVQFLALALLTSSARSEVYSKISPKLAYELVEIKPGSFVLEIPVVSPINQIEYLKQPVTFNNSYFIGKYEVTNEQWNNCYEQGGCSHPADIAEGEGPKHPVVRANWHDAFQFANWYSKITGEKYRLPTEAEWVFAMHEGRNIKQIEEEYDYSDPDYINSLIKTTKPVGAYSSNIYGIYDIKGNVWEWTLTCWYSAEENILKAVKISELDSPNYCMTRIALGENRSHLADFINDTYNGGCGSLEPVANLGFRLVKEK